MLRKVRKVRKGPLPTRRRQCGGGFPHFPHFPQHRGGMSQSRQRSDALRTSPARCEPFSSCDPKRKPLARSTVLAQLSQLAALKYIFRRVQAHKCESNQRGAIENRL